MRDSSTIRSNLKAYSFAGQAKFDESRIWRKQVF